MQGTTQEGKNSPPSMMKHGIIDMRTREIPQTKPRDTKHCQKEGNDCSKQQSENQPSSSLQGIFDFAQKVIEHKDPAPVFSGYRCIVSHPTTAKACKENEISQGELRDLIEKNRNETLDDPSH